MRLLFCLAAVMLSSVNAVCCSHRHHFCCVYITALQCQVSGITTVFSCCFKPAQMNHTNRANAPELLLPKPIRLGVKSHYALSIRCKTTHHCSWLNNAHVTRQSKEDHLDLVGGKWHVNFTPCQGGEMSQSPCLPLRVNMKSHTRELTSVVMFCQRWWDGRMMGEWGMVSLAQFTCNKILFTIFSHAFILYMNIIVGEDNDPMEHATVNLLKNMKHVCFRWNEIMRCKDDQSRSSVWVIIPTFSFCYTSAVHILKQLFC